MIKGPDYTVEDIEFVCKTFNEYMVYPSHHGFSNGLSQNGSSNGHSENGIPKPSEIEDIINDLHEKGSTSRILIRGSIHTDNTILSLITTEKGDVYPDVNLNVNERDRQGPTYEAAQEDVEGFMMDSISYLNKQKTYFERVLQVFNQSRYFYHP